MSSPSQAQIIIKPVVTLPVGSGRFASNFTLDTSPAGYSINNAMTIGTTAGSVNKIYNADPQSVTAHGSALTIDLSAVTQPDGTTAGMLHISHIVFENIDSTNNNVLTIAPAGSNGVTWLPSAGIALPPPFSAGQTSVLVLAVPSGLAISGTTGSITITSSVGTNAAAAFNLTVFGRSA